MELFQEKGGSDGPVVCLGQTFLNEKERREYFREELRKMLSELQEVEGFPKGNPEDIIALSDPPYYTACPNPWLSSFLNEWGAEEEEEYNKIPFIADVSEGKNDPLYKIPSYFTKVPPKAILRYLLHYTKPGDVVLDSFCGSGMTGLAAQLCSNESYVKELGYNVDENKNILENGKVISQLGKRNAILVDLSPAAAFTASVMNSPLALDSNLHEQEVVKYINENIAPLYKTRDQNEELELDYVVWSYWGECASCGDVFRLYDQVIDWDEEKMKAKYPCPSCQAMIEGDKQRKAFITEYDEILGRPVTKGKATPVLVSIKKGNKAIRKEVEPFDLEQLKAIPVHELHNIPEELPYLHLTHERNNLIKYWGFSHIHDFYSTRNYYSYDKLVTHFFKTEDRAGLFALLAILENNATKRNRFYVDKRRPNGSPIGPLSNTLYVPNLFVETNVGKKVVQRLEQMGKQRNNWVKDYSIVTNQSATDLKQIPENSIDFIFTDPPFGGNINYSEQNYLSEWWLKVRTNNSKEAITNTAQGKNIMEYQQLMEHSFKEYYRVLKSNRWIVVEFHNSSNLIWNSIQQALEAAGFIVANISILDKKHDTLHQGHKSAAVNKDLVISAYKSTEVIIQSIEETQDTDNVWLFVENHLRNLPVVKSKGDTLDPVMERKNFMLFDRMVAFYVQRGLPVPLAAAEFYRGLHERFFARDDMYFLQVQALEYDNKKMTLKETVQLNLFVVDERSAIQWLKEKLFKAPKPYKDIYPDFIKALKSWDKYDTQPELMELLQENFLLYDGEENVPSQIHRYLSANYKDLRNLDEGDRRLKEMGKGRWYVPDPNKQADLELLREKMLLREFEGYKKELEGTKKRLKQFRTEAIRAGFKKAWSEKDFATIVHVGERLPEKVLLEDDKLLMYFDNAQMYMDSR